MNLTETHQIRPNHKLYSICDELCFKSKNLYNAALFEFRQSFFDKELDTSTWQNINRIFNQSNQFDYRELPSKVSNAVLKKLGNNISSFWSLIKKSDYDKKVRLPKYLHKTDGRFIVEFNKQTFSNKRDEDDNLIICKSSLDLRIPTRVENPQQIRIVPKVGCYVIEVIYEIKENKLKQNQRVAAIDLGLNNLATVVTNDGDNPILISGRKIKSINQYYNKMTSKKNSLLPYNVFTSKSLDRLWLTYKCKLLGITVITREESYTSKASFLDYDEIPNYKDEVKPKFSGKRIKRGLYRSTTRKINADVNGAYNTMVKENPNYIIGNRKQLGFNPILIKL